MLLATLAFRAVSVASFVFGALFMQLLISPTDHFKYLTDSLTPLPEEVLIATYGIFAGLLPDGRDTHMWGEKYQSETRKLLEAMRPIPKVRIMIGMFEYKSCKGKQPCIDCEKQYVYTMIRHLNHRDKFKEFEWRVIPASHIKCVLFTYQDATKRGLASSRNFTDSSWEDISIALDEKSIKQLETHVDSIWTKANLLNGEAISDMLEKQGIAPRTIEKIMSEI